MPGGRRLSVRMALGRRSGTETAPPACVCFRQERSRRPHIAPTGTDSEIAAGQISCGSYSLTETLLEEMRTLFTMAVSRASSSESSAIISMESPVI